MQIQPLRGFREFYPEQMCARRKVFDKLTAIARAYGFREIDMPSLESLDLLKLKSGEGIVDETFSFKDKGGRDVTLIPETTPSIARMVGSRKAITKPVRWFSLGKLWRYEEPQAGRLREFYQLNIDIFGVPGVEADAEVVAFSVKMMEALGLSDEFVIKISDRNLLSECFGGADANAIFRVIDKRAKLPEKEFLRQLEELGIKDEKLKFTISLLDGKNKSIEKIEEFLPKTGKIPETMTRLTRLFQLLESYGVRDRCELDVSIVRGLAYYSGMVFECHDAKGELRALFGGGRYDGLVQLFGGEPTPAVGFALGDAVLEILMKRSNLWPDEKLETDYFIVLTDEKYIGECIKIAESLRKKGLSVEWDILKRKVGAQMKYADKIGAKRALFIGEDELKHGNVMVRDMATGEQVQKPLSEFIGN